MRNGDNAMAQAVYLAQLFAARNTCNCEACQLLRKVSADMTADFLGEPPNRAARRQAARRTKTAPHTDHYAIEGEGK